VKVKTGEAVAVAPGLIGVGNGGSGGAKLVARVAPGGEAGGTKDEMMV
jgi:hypothetical protein